MRRGSSRSLARGAAAGVALALLIPVAASGQGTAPAGDGAEAPRLDGRAFVPGEVVVRFAAGTDGTERRVARADADASLERRLRLPRAELLDLDPGQGVRRALAELEHDPNVLYAQPNFRYRATATPDDPLFGLLWGLDNTGQGAGYVTGADIDAPGAWDTTTGSGSVVVAVADTGIDLEHPDLVENLWTNQAEAAGAAGVDDDGNGKVDDLHGWDEVDGDADPADLHGHGTHVAGTIGAQGDDGVGVAGVIWDVALMPVRVLDRFGSGTTATVADGFDYAADNGAEVVNASLSGSGFDQVQLDAIANHPGTLFVVAAGNDGEDADAQGNDVYPCEYQPTNLICVAATGPSDALAGFSNFGATSVDLAAPGVSTLSTYAFSIRSKVHTFSGQTAFESEWVTGGSGDTWARAEDESTALPGWTLSDSPGADYANGTDSWARLGPLDLSGYDDCQLRYSIEAELAAGDLLEVETSSDGASWDAVGSFDDAGAAYDVIQGLGGLAGSGTAYARFHLIADGAGVSDGVHLDDVRVQCRGSSYAYSSGTSMAAPHVSGTAALLLAAHPGASPSQLRGWLLGGVDQLAGLAGKVASGGRLNAARSLAQAAGAAGTPDQPDSTGSGTTAQPRRLRRGCPRLRRRLRWARKRRLRSHRARRRFRVARRHYLRCMRRRRAAAG